MLSLLQMMHQTKKFMRAVTLQRPERDPGDDVPTRDNSIDFGAAELQGYNVVLNVVLQVGAGGAGPGRRRRRQNGCRPLRVGAVAGRRGAGCSVLPTFWLLACEHWALPGC